MVGFIVALFLSMTGAAWLIDQVGVSMILGAFLLGMQLAASDYRYQIVTVAEPFKGVQMGLFFVAVGMSIDMQALVADWQVVLALIAAVLLIRTAVLLGACLLFGTDIAISNHTAFFLAQVGEFAFVPFTAMAATVWAGIFSRRNSNAMIAQRPPGGHGPAHLARLNLPSAIRP